jgi:hypothetical protein
MDIKETLIVVGGCLLFFFALFFVMGYSDSLTNDCRIKGLQAGRPAIEIQAVCSRH